MAAKMPELCYYTCEICGLEGLNEEALRMHTINYHLEGAASCPFCDFSDVSPDELLIHVNTAHLDYLTPEDEMLDFIDDDAYKEVMSIQGKSQANTAKNINVNNNNYNINNINNNYNDNYKNNNNAVSTSSGAGAQGSPLRTQLNLNLRGNTAPSPIKVQPSQQCMLCGFTSASPTELEEHINRQHFDLTSPTSVTTPTSPAEEFRCPLCVRSFPKSRDLEFHVNMEHKDILSPAKCSTPGSLNYGSDGCPVCCRSTFKNNQEMVAHIEEHFNYGTPASPDIFSDRMLAKEIEKKEKESRKQREQKEFELLQAQYGMDNQGNFKEQSLTNMQKAVYAGEMSVSDFYERQFDLKYAEHNGVDDGRSCTKDLIPKIRALSQMTPNVLRTLMCTTVDHYASTYGDKGWGCGYRNLQMLISSLVHHTGYNERLFKPNFGGGNVQSINDETFSRATPSISKLQQHIEWAWRQGFDVQGCDQLGGKLHNTRKWIGATEVVTVLSSLRIRCLLVDFDRPRSPDGSHPELFNWVLEYFQKYEDFKPPLYLQHQGHSRTIVGIEEYKDGHLTLLIFDPSHTVEQMNQLKSTTNGLAGMRLIRRTLSAMKAHQYQVVAVRGIMETESEYQQSKLLHSTRIPQEL